MFNKSGQGKPNKKYIEPVEAEKSNPNHGKITGNETAGAFLDQLFGYKPEQSGNLNYTPINNNTGSLSEQDQIEAIRAQIKQEQINEQQKKAAAQKQFEYVKEESRKAIEQRRKQEYDRKKAQVEEEQKKIEEQKQKQQAAPAPEPAGKVRRSIFSVGKPKKTAETKVGFGKQ